MVVDRLIVPAGRSRRETVAGNSRFVATLVPVMTVGQAREFIGQIRSEFPGATHHVPAYIIGHGPTTTAHSHDDGEPSGTAGKPILAVLKGSGLGDAALVVTRYFGGTKLGTGGLVRAYGAAARQVIADATMAEKVATQLIQFTVPYNLVERIRQNIDRFSALLVDELFAAEVSYTVRVAQEKEASMREALIEFSHGRTTIVAVGEPTYSIVPLAHRIDDDLEGFIN